MMQTINLLLRFILEMLALGIFAYWGRQQAPGIFGFAIALIIPLFAAAFWSTFAVLNDPSRSGKAPIPVSGKIRLVIEFLFWLYSALALLNISTPQYFYFYIGVIIVNNILLWERNKWIYSQPKGINKS